MFTHYLQSFKIITPSAHLWFSSPFFCPSSDQHQISPCNINAYSAPEVMRIKDMITQGELC